MKILLASVTLFLTSLSVSAQNFHLDLYAGASNYNGDLQAKRYTFSQAHLAGGFGVSYDLTDQFTLRSALMFGKVSANDRYSKNYFRNLNFTSAITEVNLGLQYYIYPMGTRSLTPYVFAGVAVFHFNPYTYDTAGKKTYLRPLSTEGQGFIPGRSYYNLTQLSIPYGAGIKLSLSDDIDVGLELGYRKTFTDYLDDVSSTYVDQAALMANRGSTAVELAYRGNELKNGGPYPAAGAIRGNPKLKDSYYFTTLTLSFRLFPNSGGGGGNDKSMRQLSCPRPVN
ncbi:MAG: outer membrane beta-barrel protein [Bacteroidota bacterium]|nr:outer membrane beta-barrel protein [Bacteroidota bacterium]